MDSTVIVILVIVVVVALAIVAYVVAQGTKKREQARVQAEQLRSDPVASGAGVHDASLEAQRAEEEAARLRREAEQAESRAHQAEQGVAVEQARQEDVLREADRVDPDVKHRSDEYEPTQPVAGPTPPTSATDTTDTTETPAAPDTRTDPDQGVATLGQQPQEDSPPRR